MYKGSHRIEQEDFPKKKKTLGGTLGNSPAATASVSSPPGHLPVQGLCTPTGECPHLILEGTETTDTRESANQGRLRAQTHSLEEAYHKKEWVEARNTLEEFKKDIESNTIIVGDFNTPLSKMDRSSKQNINKDTVALNKALDEME